MFSEELIEVKGDCFIIDMMYAVAENMTGCAVYERIGFGNQAYVRPEMWQKLEKIIPYLEAERLKLKIRDAYRPPIAHEMLHDIIPIEGFFATTAERSLHCHGTAIDCCLCDNDGREFSYPTNVDAYTPEYAEQLMLGKTAEFKQYLQKARHDYISEELKEEIGNRKKLKSLMENIGLEPLIHEWWHYNLPGGRDFPLVIWQKD